MFFARKTNKPLPRFAFRLTRWYAGSFLLFLAAAFLALYGAMATVLDRRMDEDLQEDAAEFALFYRQGGLAKVKAEIANEMATESAELVCFRVLSDTGELIYSSALPHWPALR